ncbi:DNA cytosine methyltransferase [uncultured Campylobacter sp.]|uniref:DNA cytosine methyltransferase n=1 Tax=uncultured Campylobacter sp. TaxID=218934 RepID=UPI002617DA79|nr:DNA cytosine methyltransferase [uncultured Campylobacter sp.]
MKISAVDLFCGVGGLTCGLKQSGINVIAGIDFDESCKFAYEKNNGGIFIHKSICEVNGNEINALFRNADIKILVGCAPCQPFSAHQKNKKDRSSHKDWGLLYDFLRLVQQTSPQIVSMENVPELRKEKVFADFVESLKLQGYSVKFKIHNASDYGVAQRRKRLLLLASKFGDIDFLVPESDKIVIRDVILNMDKIEAGVLINNKDKLHISPKLNDINIKRIKQSKPGGSWHDWDKELLPNCYKKASGQSYRSVYGRMSWDDVAPTLTTQFINYGTGRFGHPEQNRAISLREGALLQSFPMEYKFVDKDEKINMRKVARQIGNAVPPKLGEHIGKSILKHLKQYQGNIDGAN